MKVIITAFLLLLQIVENISEITKCCPGENTVANRKCSDGSPIKALSCPYKFLLTNDSDLSIDKNYNLVTQKALILSDQFCITRFNNSEDDIFLVCFEEQSDNIFLIDAILGFISVFFIILTIAVYSQLPELLDLQGICILHSISGLALTFLVLGITQISTINQDSLCITYAYMIYFCSLYSFFWLNTLSFHVWKSVTKPKIFAFTKYWTCIYYIYAIGGSISFLIFLIIANHSTTYFANIHPGLGENKCWFKSIESQFIYFYGPISCLLCLNIIYYAWTIAVLWRQLTKCNEKKTKILKYKLILCVKLFFVMGITWTFEVLSAAIQDVNYFVEILWIITDCINALQGILIFLILVVFRKRVLRGLANRTIFGKRLPNRWRNVADDECEEIEEEYGLSETQINKA